MSWSLGEIRSLAIKATRGAGMPWGLAEEAGYSVTWLEERSIRGVQALAVYLQELSEHKSDVCPIASGAAISDFGDWRDQFPRQLQQPILVVPFLAGVLGSESVVLEWSDHSVVLNAAGVTGHVGEEAIGGGIHRCQVREGVVSALTSHRETRVRSDRKLFVSALEEFAHKTYAPSTEESRAKGAGAGLSDND
ncbi:MAG: DUF3726 domain-containing protein [Pseudomonadota bacterium]